MAALGDAVGGEVPEFDQAPHRAYAYTTKVFGGLGVRDERRLHGLILTPRGLNLAGPDSTGLYDLLMCPLHIIQRVEANN